MKSQVFNPYLPEWEYVPDGEPHVFGDRVYVYGSHDRFGAKMFCVDDYVCWSAPVDDLSDWRYEGVIYRRNQDPKNRLGLRLLFAPDAVQGTDGRYYLFYAFDFMGIMGVAVCDEPAGAYEFLGHVSWPDGTPYGKRAGDGLPFDPGVLVDDDGRVWLYTGFATPVPALATGLHRCASEGGYVLELEPDMTTIRGEQRLLFPKVGPGSFEDHAFFEASSIRKHGDTYVFVYSSEHNHELCYATSKRPDGGFAYGGTLVSLGDVGLDGREGEKDAVNYLGNTHGGLLRLGEGADERWYVFYHRQTNRSSYARQACAERLEGNPVSGFSQARVTSCGLNGGPLVGQGTYSARIACVLRSGEGVGRVDGSFPRVRLARHPYFTQEGRGKDARQYIANLRDGAVVGFRDFDLSGLSHVSLTVRGKGQGGFAVATDEDFWSVLGTVDVLDAGGEWKKFEGDVGSAGECEALYLRAVGDVRFDLLEVELS
ncbi:family 43 glycosylhydrolase [Paratractidigestivibacter sp.]|uniref:family 43 glycosylhydrolase n=1 Tax=Paratractidigestivibacter sp. TaxID=2847316 RepID=UPI002ABDF84E|nr:family 43 glycosylhydrolase [Paratractidigestivibacter sp.]